MTRRREGVRERKCGCLYFDYGPPVLCHKHEQRAIEAEEKQLRRVVREQLEALDHDIGRWMEYESRPGKWTTYCLKCGRMAIVYDEPPEVGDQVASWAFQARCDGTRGGDEVN